MRRPTPFGKYYLLDRVNVGGMAEVFRAKATGVEGFEKLVAIKRILPNIAEDDEFITMFIDEAKISVQLSHANVAQIYDLGKIDESYFIAMEFIAGKDLRTIFERSRKRGEILPISMSCYVIARVCEGLDYAHRKKDQQGRDLHIVHRDVSPQNILTSYEGEVKLIDFGIAKAANKASKTQAGILKGKFGYMSPEQVRGLPIDRRSDVFSVGIVLYELLTSERLFVGESDFSTLEKVRNVEIMPPTTYNKRIPEELEAIVLKALAREPEERYQSAAELQEDLSRLLASAGNIFSRRDLAQFMKSSFNDDIHREENALHQFKENQGKEPSAVQAAAAALPSRPPPPLPISAVGVRVAAPLGESESTVDDDQKTRVYDGRPGMMDEVMGTLGDAPHGEPILVSGPGSGNGADRSAGPGAEVSAPPPRPPAREPRHRSGPTLGGPFTLAPFESDPIDAPGEGPAAPQVRTISSVTLETNVGPAPIYRMPLQHGQRRRKVLMLVTGVAILTAAAILFLYLRGLDAARPSPFEVTTSAGAIVRICEGKAEGAACKVLGTTGADGKLTGEATSGKHRLVVERVGCETREVEATLVHQRQNTLAIGDLACTAAAGPGALNLDTDPSGASLRFTRADLAAWAAQTPLQRREIPPGNYEVEVTKKGFFAKKITLTVKPAGEHRETISLNAKRVRLTVDSQPTGAKVVFREKSSSEATARADATPAILKVARESETTSYVVDLRLEGHEPASVEVRFDGKLEQRLAPVVLQKKPAAKLPDDETAPVAKKTKKPKKPKKAKPAAADEDPEPEEPKTATKNPAPEPLPGTLDVNLKGAWAYVHIDGKNTGKPTPLVGMKLRPGRYRVTLVRDELGFFQEFMVVIAAGKLTRALRQYKPRD